MPPEDLDALLDRRVTQAVEVEEARGSSVLLTSGGRGGGGGIITGVGGIVVLGPVLGCCQGRGKEEGVVWVGAAARGLAALWAQVETAFCRC
jgi:hypothetical protein